jgi:hypothetical protein
MCDCVLARLCFFAVGVRWSSAFMSIVEKRGSVGKMSVRRRIVFRAALFPFASPGRLRTLGSDGEVFVDAFRMIGTFSLARKLSEGEGLMEGFRTTGGSSVSWRLSMLGPPSDGDTVRARSMLGRDCPTAIGREEKGSEPGLISVAAGDRGVLTSKADRAGERRPSSASPFSVGRALERVLALSAVEGCLEDAVQPVALDDMDVERTKWFSASWSRPRIDAASNSCLRACSSIVAEGV